MTHAYLLRVREEKGKEERAIFLLIPSDGRRRKERG